LIDWWGFKLYKWAAQRVAKSQNFKGSLAEFKRVLAQLFKVWFNLSALPFCWGLPGVEWIKLIPSDWR